MSSEFQNRVRKHLGQPSPAQHPAPDVLNAYTEQALTAPEQQQVLEHLSVCAECREVVYLASTAVEVPMEMVAVAAAASPAATSPASAETSTVRERRFRWWTWALPVAAVLAVGSVLLFRPLEMKHSAPAQVAQYKPQPQQSEPKSQPAAPAAAPAPARQMQSVDAKRRDKDLSAPVVAPRMIVPRDESSQDKGANQPVLADRLEQYNQLTSSRESREKQQESKVSGALAAAAAPAPAQISPSDSSVRGATVEVTGEATVNESVAKSVTPDASAKNALAYSTGNLRAKKAENVTRWAVTADGKISHFVLGRWQVLEPDPNPHFLVVSSVGKDVWVAGKGLMLYHSADDGVTWERQVVPSKQGGDIVEIAFSTRLEGVLKTDSGGIFASHDGGKNWIKISPVAP